MKNTIFISYIKEDFHYAESVFNFLSQNGFEPWMDKKNLLPGQRWDLAIKKALREADFILLLLSSGSVNKRGYIQREFNQALEYCEEKLDSDIYIIPIKIDSCEIPTKLGKFQWIEYSSPDYQHKILEAIRVQQSAKNKIDQQKFAAIPNINKSTIAITQPSDVKMEGPFKTKKNLRIFGLIVLFTLCFILIYGGIEFFRTKPDSVKPGSVIFTSGDLEKVNDVKKMNKERMYSFLDGYFNSLNGSNNASDFFADKIDHFYKKKNLTVADIDNIRRANVEFIDNKHEIDKKSLSLYQEKDGIVYWRFWNTYTCYRPSLREFENCKVLMEFGINGENKITSIKEIEIVGLKFSKSKPK